MTPDSSTISPPTLRDYLSVIRRRAWIIVPLVVCLPVAMIAIAAQSPHRYAASAEVLLRKGSQTQGGAPAALRAAKTEAQLARARTVAGRALTAAKVGGRTPQDLLANSSVTPTADADILQFRVVDSDPRRAATLATAYARGYTTYRRELDTAALARARDSVGLSLRDAISDGGPPALIKTLRDKASKLQVEEALRPDAAVLVAGASEPVKVGANLIRRGLLGVGVALILGTLIAFIAEALDTRVRLVGEIASALRLPLLARLPRPPRQLRTQDRPIMLDDPYSPDAEAYRVLRTNLEFFNLEHGVRSIMISSAGPNEGKTTTTVNLAVVLARGGHRVVVVDLDLRQPKLDRFFAVPQLPGLTDVVLGRLPVEDALVRVPLVPSDDVLAGAASDVGPPGTLEVLTAGSAVRNVGELVGSRALTDLLDDLQTRADLLLIDGPPLLGAGDGIALMSRVEGLLLATRLNELRRPILEELAPLVENAHAVPLGFVATGASFDGSYVRAPVTGATTYAEVAGDRPE